MSRTALFLNPAAHRGRARELLDAVQPRVAPLNPTVFETVPDQAAQTQAMREALAAGFDCIIAAGGDGTVHALVNALWQIHDRARTCPVLFGAIGLGSSNDFHKPTGDRVPVRLDIHRARPRDVVRVRHDDTTHVFVASASLGVTAEANAFFNCGDRVLHALKGRLTDLAIPYAALHTIARFRSRPARLLVDGEEVRAQISNLSVLKTPFVSGSLRYDVPVSSDDGRIAVTLCDAMTRPQLVATMLALYRGEFTGRPRTRAWSAKSLRIELEEEAPLELDGEVVAARSMEFEVLPGWLQVCGS